MILKLILIYYDVNSYLNNVCNAYTIQVNLGWVECVRSFRLRRLEGRPADV
jgi:hypothetical protein